MKMTSKRRNVGSTFLFSLIVLLIMSLASITLINNALLQQKISAGDHRETTSFEATESAIQASINWILASSSALSNLMTGQALKTCLTQKGIIETACDTAGFPLSIDAKNSSKHLLVDAETTYLGAVPAFGFAQESAHYERFSTVGKSRFSDTPTKNASKTHEQVWQFLATSSAIYREE